jgi:hypothetical protein
MRREYTKKQILESKQLLKEDGLETALMIAGFVPVIGEIADIILIIRYIYKKEYLYAGLMLIALIPTVGDFIAKPIIKLLKSPLAKGALKNTDNLVEFASKNPKFAEKYVQIGKYLNSSSVNNTIKSLEKVPVVGSKAAGGLRHAMAEHTSAIGKILQRPIGLGKQVGSTIRQGGKFSTGVKTFFQGEKLAQYIAKTGKAPSTWLSNWWNVVMPARRGRRNAVKQFIIANGVLAMFGLPSFDAFERKFNEDEKFREQLANDPKFSQVVNQTTDENDLRQIEQMDSDIVTQQDGNNQPNLGGEFGLNFLKMMAQRV